MYVIPEILEQRAEMPLLELLEQLGGWPMLQPDWDSSQFDWVLLMAQLRLYNNDILISEWVGPDIKNSDKYIIQVCSEQIVPQALLTYCGLLTLTHCMSLKPQRLNDFRVNDPFHAFYKVTEIKTVTNIKFLGLGIEKHLDWVIHIQDIMHVMYHCSSADSLKMIYFIHFHLIMKSGNIFLGNSTDSSLSVTEANCENYDMIKSQKFM